MSSQLITAQADHSSYSHPTLVTLHCNRPMQPISCPSPFPVLPPPSLSSSAAYTRRTMPIDPIQSHHPLPFKYFSVTQLNYCYLSPGRALSIPLCSLSLLCICMSGTRWQLLLRTRPQMRRSHSAWLSTNPPVNSFQYSRVLSPLAFTGCLSLPRMTPQTPHSEYGIQIYIFRCNFNVTGTIKGYILWFSESEPGCHVSCATSWHIGSDVTWRVTLWRDIASCLMRAPHHITHHMSSWFMAGWLQAHVMFQTLIAIEVCILVNFLYNLTTLKPIKINSRIKNLNFLSAALTW